MAKHSMYVLRFSVVCMCVYRIYMYVYLDWMKPHLFHNLLIYEIRVNDVEKSSQ